MKTKAKKPVAIAGMAVVVLGAMAGLFFMTNSMNGSTGTTQADVDQIQREMRAQTPVNLDKVPPELAQKGVRMMGGKKD